MRRRVQNRKQNRNLTPGARDITNFFCLKMAIDRENWPKMAVFPDMGQNGAELTVIVAGMKDAPYHLESKSKNRTEIWHGVLDIWTFLSKKPPKPDFRGQKNAKQQGKRISPQKWCRFEGIIRRLQRCVTRRRFKNSKKNRSLSSSPRDMTIFWPKNGQKLTPKIDLKYRFFRIWEKMWQNWKERSPA